jgi:G3E family GTPase
MNETPSPFEKDPVACATSPTKTPASETVPAYRQPIRFWKRLYRSIETALARISGKPDPHRIVPVTVLTGFLGAGKTTLIISLMKQLPPEYRVAWLKNEFGSTAVDSELASDNNISTVKEMLQGCICHVLIGQLGQALDEMLASNPDRIIIETSGSAAPAPIVWEIRKHPRLIVDGVITVIDAINFPGYKDKSYTAKLQAEYTDLILINKHEGLSETELDRVLDDVYELNPNAPKFKTDHSRISPDIVFGLDSRLFETQMEVTEEESHIDSHHQELEVDIMEISSLRRFTHAELKTALETFPKEHFYRIKGVLNVDDKTQVLNWAFGSFQLMPIRKHLVLSRIVFMGTDIRPFQENIRKFFSLEGDSISFTPARHHHGHHN